MYPNQQARRVTFSNTENIIQNSPPSWQPTANKPKKTNQEMRTDVEALVNKIFLASEKRQPAKPADTTRKTDNHEANMNPKQYAQKPANPTKETVKKPANTTDKAIKTLALIKIQIEMQKKMEESEQRLSELHKKMWREIKDREDGMAREIFHIRNSQMLPNRTSPPPPQHSVAWIAHLVSSSSSSTSTLSSASGPTLQERC